MRFKAKVGTLSMVTSCAVILTTAAALAANAPAAYQLPTPPEPLSAPYQGMTADELVSEVVDRIIAEAPETAALKQPTL